MDSCLSPGHSGEMKRQLHFAVVELDSISNDDNRYANAHPKKYLVKFHLLAKYIFSKISCKRKFPMT